MQCSLNRILTVSIDHNTMGAFTLARLSSTSAQFGTILFTVASLILLQIYFPSLDTISLSGVASVMMFVSKFLFCDSPC